MLRLDADRAVEFCDGLRRRDFLHAGSLSALGLSLNSLFSLKALGAVDGSKDVNCIMLMLVGGPSQLDTWDMKPNAPAEIRGPYKPIKTNVPGIEISEIFPRMAKHADKFSLVRSRLSHRRGRPRHRPSDDADRPAVPGRHRASAHRLRARQARRARKATCRRTSCCPGRSATPAATCRTARTPAFSARRTIRSC